MIEKLKKQNFFVIFLEVALIIFVVIGITYAVYNLSNNLNLKTSELGIDTDIYGDTSIDSDNIKLIPMKDSEVSTNNSNVLKINFKVRGNKNNIANNIIYDIALVNLEVDCELLSKYLKWELIKNNEVISSGNFSPEFDTITNNRLVLTNIQQDLVDYGKDPDEYEFRLWLSDSCQSDNILECENSEDQTNLLNKSISGRLEVELYTGSKKTLERTPTTEIPKESCIQNLDQSGANRPTMDEGMIAVYYDAESDVWKKADSTNSDSNYQWYDYNNKMWANSVLVKDLQTYQESKLGTTIQEEDIAAFYVWIPRYKYQVWNIAGEDNLANKYQQGISIEFELGKTDSGEITCTNQSCVGNNGEWVTHPAFTQKNIKGFWVAKYETKGTSTNPIIKDTGTPLTNYSYEQALNTSLKFLDYNINDLNMELMTNLDWGAVVYLSYSKYGSYVENSDRNIYTVYGLEDNADEMVKWDYNILGSASYEVGSKLDSYPNVVYRSGLFNIKNSSNNYQFRNVLYR